MQLSKIMLAVAAVATAATASSAFAAPAGNRVAVSAGASAIQGNLTLAIRSLCVAPNVATSFISGNFTTIVCADAAVTGGAAGTYVSKPDADFKNFAGLPYAEFRVNVGNGSFGNIQILNGVPFTFRNPATLVNTDPAPAGAVIVGGANDVQPEFFPLATIGNNTLFPSTAIGIAQVFGVAASSALYDAMFADQKASGLIPASCNLADTGISYCIPSIGKPQMATIMADSAFNSAYLRGVGFLAGAALDGVELRYARRVDTSGTQASAQNYFLGLPCSKGELSIVPEPTTDDEVGGLKDALINSIRVMAAGGTGDVRTELNKPGLYVIGVMSGENNQAAQSWKWLRVNGVAIGENAVPGTAGITNSNTMKNGTYDFYFETTSAGGNATGDAFWATVNSALNVLPAPVGLVNATDLGAGYNKGGRTCAGSASN
ncbi:conserved exported hypothetical protein [Rubrivivax sp. A210]|uniref:hypothetical protein n=1 Tax=Rubrivivax sp. A210 TaxID=2772301 RepID=UPI0019182FD5|nr:hypothetical protein [Rubrivivax sp. A210]CAD5373510.1 conserved exported hypothetical protein [Rubrivivax sp. A210]